MLVFGGGEGVGVWWRWCWCLVVIYALIISKDEHFPSTFAIII